MASFEEHCRDCEKLLGDRCEQVNLWLDQYAVRLQSLHRVKRHHTRGIAEAGKLFGELGRQAALVHILKDCGWIPTARDWEQQNVDRLGFKLSSRFNGFWDPKQFSEAARRLLEETAQRAVG